MVPSGTDWYYETLRDLTIASTGVVIAAWTQWHNHGWLNQHGTISNFQHLTSPVREFNAWPVFQPKLCLDLGQRLWRSWQICRVWNLKSVVRIPPYRSNSQSCPSLQALPSGFEPSCSSIVLLNTPLNSVQLANSLLICRHWLTLLKNLRALDVKLLLGAIYMEHGTCIIYNATKILYPHYSSLIVYLRPCKFSIKAKGDVATTLLKSSALIKTIITPPWKCWN